MKHFVFGKQGWPAFAALTGLLFLAGSPLSVGAATNLSAWVFPGASGRMVRQPDALGNRLLDYSSVGYMGGTVPIPVVAAKTNISPVAGDNSASIQSAINYVQTLPLDTTGFRGAVQFAAGWYPVSNSITITTSGVVLRGVGDGGDTNSNTILYATYVGTDQTSSLLYIYNTSSYSQATNHNITNNYVPVGARSFNVDSTSGFSAGTTVFVHRPSPANWIQAIGMDQVSPPWNAGGYDVLSDRTITRIEGNTVTLDEPLTCALDQQYGGGQIFSYIWSGRITNVGIEHLRGISCFNPSVTASYNGTTYYSDALHTWDFIHFYGAVANAWARNVTASNFAYSCVHAESTGASTPGVRGITVRDCTSLDPVSPIDGGHRYAFDLDYSGDILFQNCYTRNDRHQFVTHARTVGPNVFVDGWSDIAYNECGPHFRWGTGAIWDNVYTPDVLQAKNDGNGGTSHGWQGANEVDWNCVAGAGFIVRNPPTAHNWLIGGIGTNLSNPTDNPDAIPYPSPPGTYDSVGTNVFPNSLYYAQLQDHLAAPQLETREYWLGDINQFVTSSPTGTVVTVDPVWRAAIQTEAAAGCVNGFDIVTNNQWVPFTFNFTLGTTDRIVAATLALAMRSYNGASTNETLYLNTIANSSSFSGLGWFPIGTGTNTSARVLDLGGQLNLLANGQLNVAVMDDVGVDWAMLELQIAPVQTLYTNSILPADDAYVRSGTNGGVNYGANTTLDVKADSSTNNQRQAYLRWNLAGCTNSVQHARIRLTPVSVGSNGLENGLTLVTNNNWSESTINWTNQPGGGKRFATWIPTANVPVEIVVTPQVQAALAGDGQLSLELISLSNVGDPGLVSYASSAYASPAFQPQLLLVSTNAWAPAAPPQITNAVVAAGGFTLSGTGPSGQGYRFLTSTNAGLALSNWAAVSTSSFAGGVFSFTDLQTTNYSCRFYRVITP